MTISISRRALATVAVLTSLCGVALVAIDGGEQSARATASLQATVSCTGGRSGLLTKNGTQHFVSILTARHGIQVPTDSASGLPSGRAQHSPYTFSLPADSPNDTNVRLLNSFVANETLTSCVFRYYHVDVAGKPALYLTVTLNNAQLLSHSFRHSNSADTVTWSLYYQKITWKGTTFTTTTTWSSAA